MFIAVVSFDILTVSVVKCSNG